MRIRGRICSTQFQIIVVRSLNMTGSHDNTARISSEEALREHTAWLRGQSHALQTAVNGAPLAKSLSPLVSIVIETLGEGARAAFYLASDDGTRLHHVVGMPADYAEAVDGFLIGPESLACG